MDTYWLSALSVFWMGVLATVSPCPMATNIASVSVIASGGGEGASSSLKTAAAYGLARAAVHTLIGSLLLTGLSSVPSAVSFMSAPTRFLGPLFIIAGVLISGWLDVAPPKAFASIKKRLFSRGASASGLAAGALFALIPCPETAALFFGGMMPLAAAHDSTVLFPLLFGIGTGLPMMAVGVAMARGISYLASRLGGFRKLESAARGATAAGFSILGTYLTVVYIY